MIGFYFDRWQRKFDNSVIKPPSGCSGHRGQFKVVM